MKLLIDGYNLMMASSNYQPQNRRFDESREKFIQRLVSYHEVKGHRIKVVFDGTKGGYPIETSENWSGVNVIYSKEGELADDVIKRIIETNGEGWVVITSDGEIRKHSESYGVTVISSREFLYKLEKSETSLPEGYDDCDDYEPVKKKKGNPRRLSKNRRKKQARLKKL